MRLCDNAALGFDWWITQEIFVRAHCLIADRGIFVGIKALGMAMAWIFLYLSSGLSVGYFSLRI